MADMWISIKDDFFEKTRLEANKQEVKDLGESSKDMCWAELESSIEAFEIRDGTLHLAFDNDLGYFSFNYDLNKDDRIHLLEDSIRLISKFKTALEALK
jgi:hypothetical protein